MMVLSREAGLLAPAERLFDALTDPSRRTRTAAAVVAGFTVLWAIFFALAHGASDVSPDVSEGIRWAEDAALRHHPPMTAWVFAGWFSVFPRAEWAAYLLAATCIGVTLWITWWLLSDWLDDGRRVVGLAMLTLLPLYTFLASKLNANTVAMPFWVLTILFFLRSFRSRSAMEAVLAGAASAGAILSKYWSVYLIAAMGLTSLLDSRRWVYFRSAAPWLSVAAGAVLIAPHVLDLVRDPLALDFMAATGSATGNGRASAVSLAYLGSSLAYAAPALLVLAALRPSRAALIDILMPADRDRRLAASVFWIAMLLPAAVNVAAPHRLTALWTFPNWSLLPIVLLAAPSIKVERRIAVRVLAVAMIVPVLAVLASPVIALVLHLKGAADNASTPNSLIAAAVVQAWRGATDRPLKWVGGDSERLKIASFYLPPGVRILREDVESIASDGAALVCESRDGECVTRIDRLAQGAGRRSEVQLTRRYLGIDGRTFHYVIVVVPPR